MRGFCNICQSLSRKLITKTKNGKLENLTLLPINIIVQNPSQRDSFFYLNESTSKRRGLGSLVLISYFTNY